MVQADGTSKPPCDDRQLFASRRFAGRRVVDPVWNRWWVCRLVRGERTFVAQLLARLVKADLWEVLAIIGVTQVCLLPLVGRSTAARAGAMLLALIVHVGLSYAFNFAFVLGQPNAVDELLGTTGQRCWDGGLFGLINWSFVMLAGTVAYDLVRARNPPVKPRLGCSRGLSLAVRRDTL